MSINNECAGARHIIIWCLFVWNISIAHQAGFILSSPSSKLQREYPLPEKIALLRTLPFQHLYGSAHCNSAATQCSNSLGTEQCCHDALVSIAEDHILYFQQTKNEIVVGTTRTLVAMHRSCMIDSQCLLKVDYVADRIKCWAQHFWRAVSIIIPRTGADVQSFP